jgi:hypothetical protein
MTSIVWVPKYAAICLDAKMASRVPFIFPEIRQSNQLPGEESCFLRQQLAAGKKIYRRRHYRRSGAYN